MPADGSFGGTGLLGVYTVLSNQTAVGHFAVNLFDPSESNIRPAPSIRIGRAEVAATAPQEQGTLEIWPWIAGAALVLLLVEWWVYHRGLVAPKLGKTTLGGLRPVLYVLIGIQASGKSTWARANAAGLQAEVVASDEIRNELEAQGVKARARGRPGVRDF